jgi:hypothetical protein
LNLLTVSYLLAGDAIDGHADSVEHHDRPAGLFEDFLVLFL